METKNGDFLHPSTCVCSVPGKLELCLYVVVSLVGEKVEIDEGEAEK